MNKQRVLQALEYVKSNPYGKWGILNVEQRNFIRDLCNSWLILDEATNIQADRIDKAIEYIQDRYNGEVLTHTFDKDNVGKLLEILDKESDKE